MSKNAPVEVTSTTHWNTTLRGAKETGHTIVVDFHAQWCGPCKQIAPYYTQLASQYPQCIFLRVDVDAQPAIAAKYKISAMPTFIIIKNGTQVDGAMVRGADAQGLQRMVATHAGPNPPMPSLPPDVEAAKTAGNAAFGVGEYEKAVEEYSKGLQILPKNVQLLGNRSFAYLRLYQRDRKVSMIMQAMEDAKLATETEGEWAKGWVRAGEVFVAQSEDVRVYKDEEGLKRVLLAAESAWMAAVGYGEGKVRRESKEKLEALRERMVSLGVPPATGSPEDFLR